MDNQCTVQVKLELGHRAQLRKKPTTEGFTHDWMVFVRGPEQCEIQHFVEKVIFRLHDSFPKPKRVCKEPPYKVEESGYAGFIMPIEVHFKNKFSNVTFFIFGPLMMILMHPYAQKRSCFVYVVGVLFMAIGLFSMYFHMTLSFLGQMLDELSILWLLASGYSIWMPRCYFPAFLKENRLQFSRMVILGTVVSTFLSFLRPTINAYVLNSIALHILYIMFHEYKKTTNKELRHVIQVSVVLWTFALTSWVSDRAFCSFWQRIHFFYLHSIWHVLISITFPYGMVTMALVDARYEMPGQSLKVRYWPRDTWPVGMPYVEISEDKSC